MDHIDLNIDNYDLEDILNLFKLDKNFTDKDLKHAYKITLMTHPDKSKLDKKFFLFFCKAFKLLKQVYEFSHKQSSCSELRNTIYDNTIDDNDEYKHIIEKIKTKKDFNKWFNNMFERLNVNDAEQDTGYASWLKSNDGVTTDTIHNMTQMTQAFDSKKQEMRSLVIHKGIQDIEVGGGYNLARDTIENYSSDIFSKLQYEDVKKAHTETVVPVTHEDFTNRKHFSSTDELLRHRKQHEELLTKEEYDKKLESKNTQTHTDNIERAYKMAKQYEETKKTNKEWWGNLLHLTNK